MLNSWATLAEHRRYLRGFHDLVESTNSKGTVHLKRDSNAQFVFFFFFEYLPTYFFKSFALRPRSSRADYISPLIHFPVVVDC